MCVWAFQVLVTLQGSGFRNYWFRNYVGKVGCGRCHRQKWSPVPHIYIYIFVLLQGWELPMPKFDPSPGTHPCNQLPDLASVAGESSSEHMLALSRQGFRSCEHLFTACDPASDTQGPAAVSRCASCAGPPHSASPRNQDLKQGSRNHEYPHLLDAGTPCIPRCLMPHILQSTASIGVSHYSAAPAEHLVFGDHVTCALQN